MTSSISQLIALASVGAPHAGLRKNRCYADYALHFDSRGARAAMNRRQQGFTLIEIALVLVIIGLLLGGVLKGRELITSARARNVIQQQENIKAAYYGFFDRYGALPGDYANTEIARILKLPDVHEILMSQGTTPLANSSPEAHRWLTDERARWSKVIKDSGYRIEQ
jgi:prepilin-type N-terminal cleavage/methylation domain-containing protein